MNRRTTIHVVGICLVVWLAFLVHSCARPSPYRDLMSIGEITRAPTLLVGLVAANEKQRAAVSVEGPCRIQGERRESLPPSPILLHEGRIRIGKRSYREDVVRIHAENGGLVRVDRRRYSGDLLVARTKNRFVLMNEVDLENYIKGVAGMEMYPSAGPEAMKAQIIAARTYAMYEVRNRTLRKRGLPFDLFDDAQSQVYGGTERRTRSISRLVDETRGMFLLWEENIFKTFYSSTCGGHTEPAWLVLGEGTRIPPLQGTQCGYCGGSKYYEWSVSFPLREVEKALFPAEPRATIRDVVITRKLPGGHAREVTVYRKDTAKVTRLQANQEFRLKLGWRKLRSTLWTDLTIGDNKLTIRGRGWGHGAGMCQVGAFRMAETGKSAIEILEHYFPGARVKKVY